MAIQQERNFLDYVYVLVKWRWLVICSCLIVSLAAAGISLVLPKAWTARTLLLPPEEESDQFGLSTLLGAVPQGLGRLVGASTPADRLKTILESRLVVGALVDSFALVKVYQVPSRDEAMDLLGANMRADLGDDGALAIEVTAPDSVLAADMANAFAGRLDRVNRQRLSLQARQLRQFLEQRLALRENDLRRSGQQFQAFQDSTGLVALEAQTTAQVEVIQGLVQEMALREARLGLTRQQLQADHEERRLLEWEVGELRRQLGVVVGDSAGVTAARALGPPLRDLPELSFQYALLSLDLDVKKELIRYLGAKYEESRYKEALNTPTIQVLDRATPPRTRSAPRRTLIVLVAAGLALVTSVVLAFVLEGLGNLDADNRAKLVAIVRLLRGRQAESGNGG
ncbi:MAG: hypothetical protein GKR89_28295 [Candidatus Latescibacteria bacterium]|nr:hypothetical protein [Candidatus Latescibacterota bacterium]